MDGTGNNMTEFVEHSGYAVDGIPFAHYSVGRGRPILLVHGVGPGTTGQANFLPLLERLSQYRETHLIDLIGFGASERKPNPPYFDIDLWVRQVAAVVERISDPVDVVGNSVGGALALKVAARTAKVRRVMAIGAPAERYAITPELARFWKTPESLSDLAVAMTPMTGAESPPAATIVEARFRVFNDNAYREYFSEMIKGGQPQLDAAALSDAEAAHIRIPVVLVHGRLDRACPPERTVLPLSRRLPLADLFLFGGCGHNVIWERTNEVLDLMAMVMKEP
jgi:pimeloyl-ACP methyl ester carboxylesterase